MAVLIAIVSYAALAVSGGPVGPLKAYADTPQIVNASAAIPEPDVYGYVYDSKGNKVPNAHVTIYSNDSYVRLMDNPTFTGDGSDGDPGYYGFFGIDIGNYTVKAEITDCLGYVYNGTAKVKKFDDRSVKADVIVQDYVFSPWIEPTPTPEPVVILDSTAKPTVKPSPLPDESQSGGLNPLYALVVSPVAIVGALILMRNKKRPSAISKYQYVDTRRSQTSFSGVNVDAGSNLLMSGFSESFLANSEYSLELEELVRSKIKHHYNDITMIHRVEKIAKKYDIDQILVYRDVKRIKSLIERGKYQ